MKKIRIARIEDAHDLIAWMADHHEDDDWPEGTLEASQWLCTLSEGEHEVPEHLVEAIEWGIGDWLEVLANYEDSEPFETCVEEVAVG